MNFKRTIILALLTALLGGGIYFFDYKKEKNETERKELEARIVRFDQDHINYIEIQKNQTRYVMQKGVDGWTILEPIQDQADNEQVEQLVEFLVGEKVLAVAKSATDPAQLKLDEFGLESPYASITIKNNLGNSQKIYIGSQKNFEGNSFLRNDSENRIVVASAQWHTKAEQNLMTYREKRLYRASLAKIHGVKVKSFQGKFEIKRENGKWSSVQYPHLVLDQNKVRELIKQISETTIADYMTEGEPSNSLVQAKRLSNPPVVVNFNTDDLDWSVGINQHEAENAVYAMTERPTNLLKIDSSKWELFGNLSLDQLRDRTSPFRFALNDVAKIYFKTEKGELNFSKDKGIWTSLQSAPANTEFSSIELVKLLSRIHDLEISEFLDLEYKKYATQPFSGNKMIILKSENDNLVLQVNWGPDLKMKNGSLEKNYYYARTNLSSDTFALEQARVDSLDLNQVFVKKEATTNEPSH